MNNQLLHTFEKYIETMMVDYNAKGIAYKRFCKNHESA